MCAVRNLPVPEIPQDPTSHSLVQRRRFLQNVRQLMLDATTMPALADYHSQYLTDLCHVRRVTRRLHDAVLDLDEAMSEMINRYSGRQLLPEYFHDLCDEFPSQL